MKDLPILFSAPMIRAIRADLKTKTRRLAYLTPCIALQIGDGPIKPIMTPSKWAKVKPGTRLWVREAHYITDDGHKQYAVYAADAENVKAHLAAIAEQERRFPQFSVWPSHRKLRHSIHMPRWASRITLEVTAVRVERLQDISEEDALAEGVITYAESLEAPGAYDGLTPIDQIAVLRDIYGGPVQAFRHLWEIINGPGSWEANPEVAVISFRRVTP